MWNQVTLVGNLGQDPELKYTTSGKATTTLSLATSEKWVGKDGQMQEKTEWHRVVLWDKMAENGAKYLRKGSTVLFVGKNATRSWEDQQGVKKYTTEIIAKDMKFLGGGQQNQQGNQQNQARPQGQALASQALASQTFPPAQQPQQGFTPNPAPNPAPVAAAAAPNLDTIPF